MLTLVSDEGLSPVNTDSQLSFESDPSQKVKIKIIGMGGCGGNAVNTMMLENLEHVDLMVANTAINDLNFSKAPCKIQIGSATTKGFGAGADPEIGLRAAQESKDVLRDHIKDADLLFITAGMGGGTGTYSSSTVAELAKELSIPTIAVVSMPSEDEGTKIAKYAQEGLKKLRQTANCTVVVSNQKLFETVDENLDVEEALRIGDQVLCSAMRSVINIIFSEGVQNVDFSDLMRFLLIGKQFCIGTARASGPNRAADAVKLALNNPFVEVPENLAALGIICSIKAASVSIKDRKAVADQITPYMTSETLIPIGISKDPNMPEGEIEVTVLIAAKESEEQGNTPYVDVVNLTGKLAAMQQQAQAATLNKPTPPVSGHFPTLTTPLPGTGLGARNNGLGNSVGNGSSFRSPRQFPAPALHNYDTPTFLKQAD